MKHHQHTVILVWLAVGMIIIITIIGGRRETEANNYINHMLQLNKGYKDLEDEILAGSGRRGATRHSHESCAEM